MEEYPAVAIMVKHGNWISLGTGVAPLVAALVVMTFCSLHWGWLIVAIAAGVFAGFLMKVFVELVRIIVDMLLPQ
ncbi:MAG: hypothetical protein JKY20_13230 [Alphaproteobacteria bacterium]|nr:hypothetical protein [Alphaproteobacteria bacterium]